MLAARVSAPRQIQFDDRLLVGALPQQARQVGRGVFADRLHGQLGDALLDLRAADFQARHLGAGLAALRRVPETEQLFSLIEELNAKASVNVVNSLSRLLAGQPSEQLVRVRERIVKLAQSARSAETRRVALAARSDDDDDAVKLRSGVREAKTIWSCPRVENPARISNVPSAARASGR